MSIFKRGKKVAVPESKDEDLGPGRRLGTAKEEYTPPSESADVKIETKSDEDDDVVEIEPTHLHNPDEIIIRDEGHHNAGKIVVKKKITGSRPEAKTLYQGNPLCGCCINWVDEPPVSLHQGPKNRAEHGNYALVVRKTRHGGEDAWKIKSITVFSPHILGLFRNALAEYPGIAVALDQVELQSPFEALLHRWDALDKGLKEEEDLQARNHFNLFRQVVEPELAPHLKAQAECREHRVIPFQSVWTIFPPGSLVTWEADGQSNIGKMTEGCNTWGYSDPIYQVTCDQVEWNGTVFGFKKITLTIPYYEGTRPVTELTVMPLDLKANVEELKKAHVQRGRAFEDLHGYHFKAYEGPAMGIDRYNFGRKTHKQVCLQVSSTFQRVLRRGSDLEGIGRPLLTSSRLMIVRCLIHPRTTILRNSRRQSLSLWTAWWS